MPDADVTESVEQAARSKPLGWAARVGLTARGFVYLALGWLFIAVALGDRRGQADQKGVLTSLVQQPMGTAIVAALAIGFACYAVWRLSEVFFGVTGERDGPWPRAASLVRSVAYGALTVTAISVLMGSRQTQEGQQENAAQATLALPGGPLVLAIIGLGFVGAGLFMTYQGVTTKFLRSFSALPAQLRSWVVRLGRGGTVARGLVFTATGGLAVLAALQLDPHKAGGIDDAVGTLLHWPAGRWIVLALGSGLVLFGLYGFAEAAWRRVPEGDLAST